jgi:uncharacterized protein YjbI with pentapeptide repeats
MTALPKRSPDAVTVMTEDGVGCVTFPFRLVPGQDALIVVAKLTLELGPTGAACLAETAELPTGDELFEPDDENSSLRYPSDFEPFKPRADVLVVGHAHRPESSNVGRAGFRFGELRRAVAVSGDRVWQGALPGPAMPFDSMPLRWERAFGGPGHSSNPVGRGYAEGGAGMRLPNLERETQLIGSERDRPEPVCFAPIRRDWPSRRQRLGSYDAEWLKERWPYYPKDFDWGTCNAAPLEQQILYPRGDESFEFFGLHPEAPVLSGILPGRAPRVLAQFGKAEKFRQQEVALVLDTVWFDTDALSASLVWRGHVPVSSESAPELELLFACLNRVEEPLPLRALREKLALKLSTLETSEVPAPKSLSRGLGFGRSIFGFQAEPRPLRASRPGFAALPEVSLPALSPALPRERVAALAGGTQSLDGVELCQCDLSGLDFSGRSFKGADLTGANLEGVVLTGAKLARAKLAGVRARGASFRDANLEGADLSGAELGNADFTHANLAQANLEDIDAIGAVFIGVVAPSASFAGAKLSEAQFHSASLKGAVFDGALLDKADFESAELCDSHFYDANVSAARLYKANLSGLRADGANLSDGNFEAANATGASFQNGNLERANFSGANLDDALLIRAQATASTFNRASACRVRFDGATLEQAKFGRANLLQANFSAATLTGAYFGGANLWQAEFVKTKHEGASFEGAFLRGTKLSSP